MELRTALAGLALLALLPGCLRYGYGVADDDATDTRTGRIHNPPALAVTTEQKP